MKFDNRPPVERGRLDPLEGHFLVLLGCVLATICPHSTEIEAQMSRENALYDVDNKHTVRNAGSMSTEISEPTIPTKKWMINAACCQRNNIFILPSLGACLLRTKCVKVRAGGHGYGTPIVCKWYLLHELPIFLILDPNFGLATVNSGHSNTPSFYLFLFFLLREKEDTLSRCDA